MEKCELCGREFSSETALSQHVNDKHGGEAPGQGREKKPGVVRKQKSLRRRDRHPVALTLVVAAVAAGVVLYFVVSPAFAGPPFPTITGESWIHMHPYLVIDIEGTNITVPSGVGLVEGGGALEPVHTHDASGLLHIELSQSDAAAHNYTLRDFFTIWNYTAKTAGGSESPSLDGRTLSVEFSSADLLGYRANTTYRVALFVDGHDCSTSSYSLCPATAAQWGSLNLEQLDYCSSTSAGSPCCPSDCSGTTASPPLWDGSDNYPYGTGHTVVLEYVKG